MRLLKPGERVRVYQAIGPQASLHDVGAVELHDPESGVVQLKMDSGPRKRVMRGQCVPLKPKPKRKPQEWLLAPLTQTPEETTCRILPFDEATEHLRVGYYIHVREVLPKRKRTL